MHPSDRNTSFCKTWMLAMVLGAAVACAGCQSPMYSGMPEEDFSRGTAPTYAPGTYEPPYQVGGQAAEEQEEDEVAPPVQAEVEQKYQYRGGRDPVTGRAKTQM